MIVNSEKVDLAKEQLEDGIALFLEERYISSLTLAGAASEVLFGILEACTGETEFDEYWERINRIRRSKGNSDISKGIVKKLSNKAKNLVKHHDRDDSTTVYFNQFGEAFNMINRAVGAAKKLGMDYKNKNEYESWLIEKFDT